VLKEAFLATSREKLVNYGERKLQMITRQQYESVVERSAQMLKQAGIVVYVPGPPAAQPACCPPQGSEAYYTV
jgi:hypothetical protein